ncbi:MAG: FAD-binding oxidoreductase [Vicinamibacterales bacterium]
MSTHRIVAREPRGDAGPVSLETSADAVAPHLEDAAHYPGGRADAIARPRTEAQVASLVTRATRVLPIGAQSSVTGGATPTGGLLISTGQLTSIQESGQAEIRAEAGVSLDALQNLLSATGRWYAPTPTWTGAFVGGVVSTNAAGAATFKYGTTRDWVTGLTVVLACGHVLDVRRGDVTADPDTGFLIDCPCGERRVRPGTYRMPDVPKCSAGYFARPGMDLIDLFVGSEGTLGVITAATLRVLSHQPAVALAVVPVTSEPEGLALVAELRRQARNTWRRGDAHGIDVRAIESLDRRCLELLREDGADRRHDVHLPATTALALIVHLELPGETTPAEAFDVVAGAFAPDAPDHPIGRFCRLLRDHGAFDATELAMPGDARRAAQVLAFREAAPLGVNHRIALAKQAVDARLEKTAADMVVPFERLPEMLACYHDGYGRRGLDHAIWGHVSDGNLHPNVIPRTFDDMVAAREAILEFGREAIRLGGSPLAEHGVGRSPTKQALLRMLYGDRGIEEMRAIKAALDPEGKLAPGVLFPASG